MVKAEVRHGGVASAKYVLSIFREDKGTPIGGHIRFPTHKTKGPYLSGVMYGVWEFVCLILRLHTHPKKYT